MQDEFFRRTIDIQGLLTALEEAADIVYFLKDAQGRAMGSSRKSLRRMGIYGDDIIGKLPHEYLPHDLADKYANDDQRVFRSGKPLRNIVEMGLSNEGARDWIITDKFPLAILPGASSGSWEPSRASKPDAGNSPRSPRSDWPPTSSTTTSTTRSN